MSACLLGSPVRYDGGGLSLPVKDKQWLFEHFDVVSCCPEIAGGLPTPKAPAEIVEGGGKAVLNGQARITDKQHNDYTAHFIQGAHHALAICQSNGIRYAILAQSSPSCGSNTIYDGSFSGVKTQGRGVTAELLAQHDIRVFCQHSVADLKADFTSIGFPDRRD